VFFTVLLVGLIVGLAFVYSRSPVYRASASVLTVKPKDVDRRSAEADLEHVAIQGRLLTGETLLGRLQRRLGDAEPADTLPAETLQGMLAVLAVPDTNLLELRAEGADPAQLQRVVNAWAEEYESFRAEEIEAASGRTIAEIEDEQASLRQKIETARAELQAFRAAHDIVSLERTENRSLSSLKGLNDSLNKARERLIEAEARRLAVDEAIARGETVIPDAQKTDISRMQLTLQRARLRLSELRRRYTEVYIERDPTLKDLPDQVRSMENELRLALQLGTRTVSDEAAQAVEAARLAVAALQTQLDEQQSKVQTFTERFKEFKSLEEALTQLDSLYTDNQRRLAQIEVRNLEKYPPIQVVEWARLPARPIYPDYQRDLLIAVAAALALALFITWLLEYLTATPAAATAPTLGVRIYPGDQRAALTGQAAETLLEPPAAAPGPQAGDTMLPHLPRELAVAEVQSLLAATDAQTRSYAILLLNGVSPYELPLLHAQCFDRDGQQIAIPGASRRTLAIGDRHWQALQDLIGELDAARMPLTVADLNRRLQQAGVSAAIAGPEAIDALALWHSYVLYLIRQGIDSSALTARVGALPGEIHRALLHFAPPGGSRPLAAIELEYPALPD
jgi:uncharacterized protein involved in exopolysaccharide biosynthesis